VKFSIPSLCFSALISLYFRLQEEAKDAAPVVYYWENVEGGHGGAADNKQKAHMWALTYSFLGQQLGLGA
jgi:prolyl oligopeptidase